MGGASDDDSVAGGCGLLEGTRFFLFKCAII